MAVCASTCRSLLQWNSPTHIAKERDRAVAENRTSLVGSAAYKTLPLTGAFQATFPWYRQRSSFGRLGEASEEPRCSVADVFEVNETGQVMAALNPDGTQCTSEDVLKDAKAWAAHFGHDAFYNHCSNHEHDCTSTCVKYVKKKLEAKQSLRTNKVPSCRFWFFRIKRMRVDGREKAKRRRGKPLVTTPTFEESDDRNQQCR